MNNVSSSSSSSRVADSPFGDLQAATQEAVDDAVAFALAAADYIAPSAQLPAGFILKGTDNG